MSKYTANDIANWFLVTIDREAGETLSHLKLQKLVYYAQVWSLALFDKPLFDEDFEAWTYGPALPSLYQRFKDYTWEALPTPTSEDDIPKLSKDEEELLDEVLQTYGSLSAKRLVELTHQEWPWQEARGGLPLELRSNEFIKKDSMKRFYQNLYQQHLNS